ncbi:MAG: PfkB family carbohydrate kinase [Planctomycetota bacterium]
MNEIVIIGTLNTEVILGPLRKLPSWGRQVLTRELDIRYAGSAVCVALPLRAMGLASLVVGTVGDDEPGRAIVRRLAEHRLPIAGVRVVKRLPTGACVSFFRPDGERKYVSSLGAIRALSPSTIRKALPSSARIVLVTGLFLLPGLPLDEVARLFRQWRRRGITTCLDTGWDPEGWKRGTLSALGRILSVTDVFLPNLAEAGAITGERRGERAARALAALGPATVIIKLGRRGAVGLFDGRFLAHRGFPRDVRDTTAAGEAFNAAVLLALRKGLCPEETLRFANLVASTFLAHEGRTAHLAGLHPRETL